ncbi:membrane-bound lytic murein transglycosylase D precursor [mine drainage metagenome]|uniref:Membrane-bound lytic murein transglycosylase D n=1 Tax=mine drainage metagenome TaxID=410659 RepID=A0A1J5SFI6_9ZZZZ
MANNPKYRFDGGAPAYITFAVCPTQPLAGSRPLPAYPTQTRSTARPLLLALLRLLFACLCLGLSVSSGASSDTTGSTSTAAAAAPAGMTLALAQPADQVFSLDNQPPQEVSDNLPPLKTIDLTTPPDDLWQRIRNGFAMPNLDSPLVADRQAWYLNRPELLKTLIERSRRYLYYIVNELQKRGMPTELALLPMVESAYNPMAYSRARASGLWQFIPSTAKNYRLQQNWWRDQRRDIIASTGAALDYLQMIYEMNGDWHLALASYNWGENAVARAIAKNQALGLPTDYATLSQDMPLETRYYVPKLQALKNIIARPELFGIKLDPIPNEPYFGKVSKPADMDVTLAARLAETPLAEFKALNPAYNRPVMLAGKGDPMLLPTDKVQIFLANLQTHEEQEKPLSSWRTYTMKRHERFNSVAAKFHITPAQLKQINGITRRTRIGWGTTLLVPARGSTAGSNLHAVNLTLAPHELPRQKELRSRGHVVGKSAKHAAVRKHKVARKHAVIRKHAVVRKHVVLRKHSVVRKHVVIRKQAHRAPVNKHAAKKTKKKR